MGKIAALVNSMPKEKKAKLMRLILNGPPSSARRDEKKPCPCGKNRMPSSENVASWQPMRSSDEKWRIHLLKLVEKRKLQREMNLRQSSSSSKRKALFSRLDEMVSIAMRNQKAISEAKMATVTVDDEHQMASPMENLSGPQLSSTLAEDDMNSSMLRDASATLQDHQGLRFLSTIVEEEEASKRSHQPTPIIDEGHDTTENNAGSRPGSDANDSIGVGRMTRKSRRTGVYRCRPLEDTNSTNEDNMEDAPNEPTVSVEGSPNEASVFEAPIEPPPSPHQYIPDATRPSGSAIQVCQLTDDANTCPSSPGCSNSPEDADTDTESTTVVDASQDTETPTTRTKPTFPVRRLWRKLKKHTLMRVWIKSAVYTAAVLDYIVSEILDLGGYIAKRLNKRIISPSHVNGALKIDEELSKLTSNVIVPFASRVPP